MSSTQQQHTRSNTNKKRGRKGEYQVTGKAPNVENTATKTLQGLFGGVQVKFELRKNGKSGRFFVKVLDGENALQAAYGGELRLFVNVHGNPTFNAVLAGLGLKS